MSAPLLIPTDAETVTPSDTVNVTQPNIGIYVGVSGDITLTTDNGTKVVYKAVPVGNLWIKSRLIWATGTTATNMLLLK